MPNHNARVRRLQHDLRDAVMTPDQAKQIIARLDAQSAKIDALKTEIDQMRGGLAVLKGLGGLLGVGGIGALLAWLQSQGK